MSVLHKSWVYEACYNLWNINWSHDSCRSNWFYWCLSSDSLQFSLQFVAFALKHTNFPNNCMKPLFITLLWLEGIALEVKRLSWLRKFGYKKSAWSWKWVSCPGSSRSTRKVGHCQLSLKSDDTAECLNLWLEETNILQELIQFSSEPSCRLQDCLCFWLDHVFSLDVPVVNVLIPLQ